MTNLAIARVLTQIGDLLEVKGENAFKIRAYRNAGETVAQETASVADMSPTERLQLPGIGKDIAAKIGELVDTGAIRYHQELLEQFPPTILDLLNLQGVGPKTVAQMHTLLNVRTVDELKDAIQSGRLRNLKGFGPRKEMQLLKTLEDQRRVAGRRLAADAHDEATALVAALREHSPAAEIHIVGSLRRGCDTCGDIDILAAIDENGADALMQAFTTHPLAARVLAHGATKSSVLLWGGFQVDLRIVPRQSFGAAMQYFTGSKTHNIALRDRAVRSGMKLNEYGLYTVERDQRVAGEDEEGIYRALGLAYVPPELRENRGEIEAASRSAFPPLIQLADLRGDLHCHTNETDGRADIETMARAARDAGVSYLAVTDHSKSLAMANGLDETRALAHAAAIRSANERLEGITLLAGIECDIRPDGSMDLADDCLAQLDIVVASIHSAFNQEPEQMTDRLLRAIDCRWVDVIGHPLGRIILKREPHRADMSRVMIEAAIAGVAMEINAQMDRRDLDDAHARRARDAGVGIIISSDAHGPAGFGALRWGIATARRAGLTPGDVLNTRPLDAFRASLRRHRS